MANEDVFVNLVSLGKKNSFSLILRLGKIVRVSGIFPTRTNWDNQCSLII